MEMYFKKFLELLDSKEVGYVMDQSDDGDVAVLLNYSINEECSKAVLVTSMGENVIIRTVLKSDVEQTDEVLQYINKLNKTSIRHRFYIDEGEIIIEGLVQAVGPDLSVITMILNAIDKICNSYMKLKDE